MRDLTVQRSRTVAPRAWLVAWLAAWALFSLPWTTMTATPHWDRVRPPHVRSSSQIRPHHVLNVLFYVPAAPLATTVGVSSLGGIAGAAVLSVAAETAQVFSSDRAPDGNDLVANVAGALIGAVGLHVYRRIRQTRFKGAA